MKDTELMKKIGINKKLLELFKQRQKEALREAEDIKKRFFEKKIRALGINGSMRSVNDSAAEGSTTEWLLSKCLDEAKRLGAEIKKINLREYKIEPCKACYSTTNAQCHYKCTCYPEGQYGDDMTNKLYDEVAWADILIFATPVNNFKVSSLMALFIDRLISMDGSLGAADKSKIKDRNINITHTKYIELTSDKQFGSGFLKRLTGKIGGIIVSNHEAGASMVISSLFMTLNNYGMLFPPFSHVYATNTACEGTYKDKEKLQTECYDAEVRMLAKNLVMAAKIAKREQDYWWVYGGGAD